MNQPTNGGHPRVFTNSQTGCIVRDEMHDHLVHLIKKNRDLWKRNVPSYDPRRQHLVVGDTAWIYDYRLDAARKVRIREVLSIPNEGGFTGRPHYCYDYTSLLLPDPIQKVEYYILKFFGHKNYQEPWWFYGNGEGEYLGAAYPLHLTLEDAVRNYRHQRIHDQLNRLVGQIMRVA